MSSIVLLNREGLVERKLQLVSLPKDFVIPEGMTISWRIDLHVSSSDPLAPWRPQEPAEAFFYFGNAQGQVSRNGLKGFERDNQGKMSFAPRNLTVTVQGTSAEDVMRLRDYILSLIHSGKAWGVSNDLNPKPNLNPKPKKGSLQRLKEMAGMTKEG